jgi:hypothetical protein
MALSLKTKLSNLPTERPFNVLYRFDDLKELVIGFFLVLLLIQFIYDQVTKMLLVIVESIHNKNVYYVKNQRSTKETKERFRQRDS